MENHHKPKVFLSLLTKKQKKREKLSSLSKNRPPKKMKRSGRSCSDAVVDQRASIRPKQYVKLLRQ